MQEYVIPLYVQGTFDEHAESLNNPMIKCYLIIKPLDLMTNITAPDVEPPLKLYTCKAAEDNACCFQELKRIM